MTLQDQIQEMNETINQLKQEDAELRENQVAMMLAIAEIAEEVLK